MPDRDPLQQLASFGTGGPVDPLPATEVRRLGDRRRARRTAVSAVTGVVAVLAVVVPAGLYAARDGGAPLPPSTSTPARATAIPDDFPIDHGFAGLVGDSSAAGPTHDDLGITPVGLCTDVGWTRLTDRFGAWHSTDELSQSRELALFPDEQTAAAQVSRFRQHLADCRSETFTDRSGNSSDVQHEPHASGAPGDGMGWVDVAGKDGPTAVTNVTRIGNAVVLVSASRVIPGQGPDVATIADEATSWLADAMCIFTEAGCEGPDAPTSGIPGDFPLDRGAHDFGAEGSRKGPNQDVAVKQPLPCDTDPLHTREVRDRLGFANLGSDFEDYRQLLLYADEADASEVMGAAATAVESCESEPDNGMTLLWTTVDADTGYETLTFRQGVQGAVGGSTYQLTRVGRAILQVAWNGEGGGDVPGQTAVTVAIAPEMCGWADGGCTEVPSGTVSEAPASGTTREIADDFPLAKGFPERSERGADGYTGPNRTIEPVAISACDKTPPASTYRDRLLARYESAEDYRTRQLTTYADAKAAVAASRAIIQVFEDCPTEGPDSEGYTSAREVEKLTLGGESWAVLDRATYQGGETPFGSTLLVVRVGRAVLVEEHGGHAGYPGPEEVQELSERLAAPIAAMCAFTAAGC